MNFTTIVKAARAASAATDDEGVGRYVPIIIIVAIMPFLFLVLIVTSACAAVAAPVGAVLDNGEMMDNIFEDIKNTQGYINMENAYLSYTASEESKMYNRKWQLEVDNTTVVDREENTILYDEDGNPYLDIKVHKVTVCNVQVDIVVSPVEMETILAYSAVIYAHTQQLLDEAEIKEMLNKISDVKETQYGNVYKIALEYILLEEIPRTLFPDIQGEEYEELYIEFMNYHSLYTQILEGVEDGL